MMLTGGCAATVESGVPDLKGLTGAGAASYLEREQENS